MSMVRAAVIPAPGRPVEVREYRHETVVLSGGVRPGQLVVTAGVQKLDAGLTVRPWEGKP